MAVTTKTLQSRLIHANSLKKVLDQNKEAFIECPVSEYLARLCEKYQVAMGDVIRQAQIERTYGYQIFNGTRMPSREKLLQLAFGFGLTLEETQELLRRSGKGEMYSRIKRDAACIFALSHGMHMQEVQELLASIGLPLLGEV
ncbi:MAG: XRE family transcriptional regulator [Lachnospiraceae bacterium]|nr:XRE family transcriptional regulator [Lachnospiraceae bacterium]